MTSFETPVKERYEYNYSLYKQLINPKATEDPVWKYKDGTMTNIIRINLTNAKYHVYA